MNPSTIDLNNKDDFGMERQPIKRKIKKYTHKMKSLVAFTVAAKKYIMIKLQDDEDRRKSTNQYKLMMRAQRAIISVSRKNMASPPKPELRSLINMIHDFSYLKIPHLK